MKNIPKAIALAYSEENETRVLANGIGELARKIIQKAKEFEVPIFSNPILADSLSRIQIDKNIPPELYEGMIEIFIWLDKIEQDSQISKK